MKKFIIITAIIITMALSDGFGQNRSIQFAEKPWSEVLAQAKKENKLIFMDAFASWCGPCKWMAANIFTNDTVADFYNKNFICCSYDMEKGEGLELRKKYAVKAYPSLLFITPEGNLVHKKVGAPRRVNDYLSMGLTAQNPEECLASYYKKYAAGDRDPLFIRTYLERLIDAYEPVTDVLASYFATQNEQDLLLRSNWTIIYNYVEDMNSKEFLYLVNHEKEFSNLYTKDSTDNKISDVYVRSLMKLVRSSSMSDAGYIAMKQKIRDSGFSGAEKVIFTSDLNLYYTRGEKQKYLDLAYDDLEKYYADSYEMLNSVSWNVFQLCNVYDFNKSKKYLEKAMEWSKKAISLKNEPAGNDTHAQILFKLGKTDEAIKYERTAIALAKRQNISSHQYEESLKKMLSTGSEKK